MGETDTQVHRKMIENRWMMGKWVDREKENRWGTK